MERQEKNRRSSRAEIVAGTTLVLLLMAGATAWAGKHDNKIQLKKDDSVQQKQQERQMDPFRDMILLQQRVEQLFGNMINPYSGFPEYEAVFDEEILQPMDLRETPEAFIVQMDLPGLAKSDISIEVKDRVLAVSGSRKQSTEKKKGEKILMQERSVNSFSREVVLPRSVDTDGVSAEYKAGVLTITLPKTEKDKEVRKIEIK